MWCVEQIHQGSLCFPDLDECLEESSCCEQDCTNYPGGYECYCRAGYRLNSDGCGCDGTQLLCSLLNLRHFYTKYMNPHALFCVELNR